MLVVFAAWMETIACAVAAPMDGAAPTAARPHGPLAVVMVGLSESLKAGEERTYDLPVDASVTRVGITVASDPNVTDLEVAILDPSGKSHRLDDDGADDGFRNVTQDKPEMGLWKVRLRAGSDVVYTYEAHADSTLVVTAETDGEAYASGAPIEFTARILNAGVPISGAHVEAWLIPDRDPPFVFQVVPLVDRGDGSYAGRAVPSERGTFRAQVVARGAASGGSFQRACALRHGLGVIPDTLKILSGRAAAVDAQGDGRIKEIPFEVEVDVRRGGKFEIKSYLADAGGEPAARRIDSVELAVGLRKIRIAFAAADFVRSGTNGPFQLARVVIQDLDGEWAPPIEKNFSGVEQRLRRDQLE